MFELNDAIRNMFRAVLWTGLAIDFKPAPAAGAVHQDPNKMESMQTAAPEPRPPFCGPIEHRRRVPSCALPRCNEPAHLCAPKIVLDGQRP
jgi:hypothetical protein